MLAILEEEQGAAKVEKLQKEIHDIIIKSICMVQPHVNHLVKSCQPDDIENQLCFQILGFDIMIDHKL